VGFPLPVAVHCVEVEFRRVDDEVVVQVFESLRPLLSATSVSLGSPIRAQGFGFLSGELDGHAVMGSCFDARVGSGDPPWQLPVVRAIQVRISCAHALTSG
jgi:hypothetical protein